MAYNKTNWKDTIKDASGNVIERGTPLAAQHLNKMEDGIEDAHDLIDGIKVIRHREEFVSAEGQDTFTLENEYDMLRNRVDVTVGGVPQYSPAHFTELTNNSIKLAEPLPAGIDVVITYFGKATPLDHDVDNVLDNHSERLNTSEAKISSISQQLADTAGDILNSDKVSRTVSLESSDVTAPLTTALSDFKDRELKYAYFDKSTGINMETPLPQNDILFFGKSDIGKIHPNNAFYFIPNKIKSFGGKVNRNYSGFGQLKTALGESRPINITVWGDSISTNGDLLGANSTTPTGSELGPDNITEGDSYTSYLYDMVSEAMPGKVFNFHNRAIGGTRISEWNETKKIGTVEKSWIEHIKDTNPDLLVIAFGMNHNTFDQARIFAWNVKQVVDYINANFTVKPDLVFVSTPRPSYHPESTWGTFEGQASRQLTANILRNVSSTYGAYLMDVNRISNIKRAGTDWLSPTFKEFDPTTFITKQKDASGNYVFSGSVNLADINKYTKDFVMKFRVEWSGAATDGDNLNISFGKTQDAGINNNQLEFTPLKASIGKTRIRSLANIADYSNWGASSSAMTDLDSQRAYINLRIEKRDNILEVHEEAANGVAFGLLLRDKINVWDTVGKITLRHNGATAGFTTTISNFRMFEPVYDNFLPELTEEEAWGVFNASDTGLKYPFGGNGVNHPSSYGIKEMYLPAVSEFVDDISAVYRNR